MITLADLLSLLVAFFALLYATTVIPQEKWRQVVAPIATYLGGTSMTNDTAEHATIAPPQTFDQNYAAAMLQHLIDSNAQFAGVTVTYVEHGLRISFPLDKNLHEWLLQRPSPLEAFATVIGGLHARLDLSVDAYLPRSSGADPIWWETPVKEAETSADILSNLGVPATNVAAGVSIGTEEGNRLVLLLHDPRNDEP